MALLCNLICILPGEAGLLPLNAVTPVLGAPVIIYVIVNQRRIQYFKLMGKQIVLEGERIATDTVRESRWRKCIKAGFLSRRGGRTDLFVRDAMEPESPLCCVRWPACSPLCPAVWNSWGGL